MSKTNDATAAAKYGFFCQSWVKLGSKITRDTSFFTSTAPLWCSPFEMLREKRLAIPSERCHNYRMEVWNGNISRD